MEERISSLACSPNLSENASKLGSYQACPLASFRLEVIFVLPQVSGMRVGSWLFSCEPPARTYFDSRLFFTLPTGSDLGDGSAGWSLVASGRLRHLCKCVWGGWQEGEGRSRRERQSSLTGPGRSAFTISRRLTLGCLQQYWAVAEWKKKRNVSVTRSSFVNF